MVEQHYEALRNQGQTLSKNVQVMQREVALLDVQGVRPRRAGLDEAVGIDSMARTSDLLKGVATEIRSENYFVKAFAGLPKVLAERFQEGGAWLYSSPTLAGRRGFAPLPANAGARMRTQIFAVLIANAAFAVGVAWLIWSKPELLTRRFAAALQVALLCTTTAVVPPLYNALPESLRGGSIVLSRCVDDQGETSTSLHPFATCAGQQRKFDTRKMDWVDVSPPARGFIEG